MKKKKFRGRKVGNDPVEYLGLTRLPPRGAPVFPDANPWLPVLQASQASKTLCCLGARSPRPPGSNQPAKGTTCLS